MRRGHPYLSLTVAINVDKTIFHEPYCTSVVGIPHLSLLKHGFVVTTETLEEAYDFVMDKVRAIYDIKDAV